MKVKELIALLQTFDSELEVAMSDYDGPCYYPIDGAEEEEEGALYTTEESPQKKWWGPWGEEKEKIVVLFM